jgi:hypothetical protein
MVKAGAFANPLEQFKASNAFLSGANLLERWRSWRRWVLRTAWVSASSATLTMQVLLRRYRLGGVWG